MKILWSGISKKKFSKLNLRFKEKILNSLKKFEEGERIDIKKLKGREEEFLIRVGNYRIILSKIKEGFLVLDIGSRESIYLIFV
jgi:mRNA-degrading endonuclease RelE of RelBE toxin-antitoxin system